MTMSEKNTPAAAPAADKTAPKKGAGAVLAEVQGKATGPKVTINVNKLPAPEVRVVKRKDVLKDRRLQHRKEIQDLSEGGAVQTYAEAMKNGAEFPELKIVEDVADGTLWLWDGYQTLGAYELNKVPEVRAHVWKGTFADALILSLTANHDNSVIPRTKDDARRSVFAALDNAEVCEAILKAGKGAGGAHRAFAAACKCSVGTVSNAFDERGIKPKGDTLVKGTPKKKEKAKPEPRANPALAVTPPPAAAEVTPAQQKKIDAEAFELLRQKETVILVADAVRGVKKYAAVLAALATDKTHGSAVRAIINESGMRFDAKAFDKESQDSPFYAMLEHNADVIRFVETMEKIGKTVEAANKAAQDKAAAEKEAADKAAVDKKVADKAAADAKKKEEADKAAAK